MGDHVADVEDLDELDRLTMAATPGPWTAEPGSFEGRAHVLHAAGPGQHWAAHALIVSHLHYRNDASDLKFIAAARGSVEALIAEVRRLRQENNRMRGALEEAAYMLEIDALHHAAAAARAAAKPELEGTP